MVAKILAYFLILKTAQSNESPIGRTLAQSDYSFILGHAVSFLGVQFHSWVCSFILGCAVSNPDINFHSCWI
jgi:hypothetical protein